MRALYTATLAVGLVVLAPVFVVRGLRRGKYLGNLRERFGDVNPIESDAETLWIHAVSVGEVLAAEPLIRMAARALEGWRVVVSTTTATGQALARERFPDLDVIYFPLDLPGAVERAMRRVRPSAVCLVETELWPNFLASCARHAVPVIVANGRISDRSFRRYRRAGRLLGPVLGDVSAFLMQSPSDADRVIALGASADRVAVSGNLKYDVDRGRLDSSFAARRAEVERALGLPDSRPLVVAGSTVEGEETLLARALVALRRRPGLSDVRMLVAPRHPDRFEAAARDLTAVGLRVVRRSHAEDAAVADVLLLDSIGELAGLYEHATVVFVGGSLVPRGGHNIVEPALFAKPIVVGPHTENFRQIVADFREAGGAVQLGAAGEASIDPLVQVLEELLTNPEHARNVGIRALGVLEANRGASGRTFELLRERIAPGAASRTDAAQ